MIDIHTLYGKTPYGQNYSFESVLQGMERFDVDYALISSLKAAYYSGPESEAEVLAVCRKHPKLLPVAGIDLRNNFSPEETVFRLKSAGFVAARFFTGINHISLDTPLFRELAAAAEALQFPLLADAPAGMVSAALRPMGPLTVPIILLSQSAYDNYDVLGAMRERKNLYLEIRGFTSPDILEYLTAHTGSGRLLFGSRAPIDYLLPTRNIVEYSHLLQEDKERILDKNARQVFLNEKGGCTNAAD